MLRFWVVLGVALVSIVAITACKAADPVANKDSGSQKIVTFRGGEVTQSELQEQLDLFAQQSGAGEISPGQPGYDAAVQQVLPSIVSTEVATAYANEQGIEVTNKDVDEQYAQIKDQVGQDAVQQAAAAGQDITPEEGFKQALQQANYTEEKLRSDIRDQLPVQKVSEKVAGDVEPSDAEVKKYYDENKDQFTTPAQRCVRHILFNKDQKAKAEEVKKQLENGGSFEKLAKEYSQDPGSADSGGDLGCQPEGTYVPNFEKAVFGADEGDLVGPVQTEFGYHVIKVYDVQAESVTPLEDASAQIRDQLTQEQQTAEFDTWVQEEEKKRNVTYLEGYAPPEATTPEGTAPEGTAPESTTPESTAPEGTAPEGTVSEQ